MPSTSSVFPTIGKKVEIFTEFVALGSEQDRKLYFRYIESEKLVRSVVVDHTVVRRKEASFFIET